MKKQFLRNYQVVAILILLLVGTAMVHAQKPDIDWFGVNPDADTFYIANADQLAGLANIVNNAVGLGQSVSFQGKTVILTDDIDLSKYGTNYNSKKGWIPIHGFRGTFDGNGKTIKGLYINTEWGDVGLFGSVNDSGSILKNVGVVDVKINAVTMGGVGSLVGNFRGKIIDNCFSSGVITGSTNKECAVGGVVGVCNSIGITSCYSSATVTGGVAGGVVGGGGSLYENKTLLVTNCYSTGKVNTGNANGSSAGGVAGRLHSVIMSNCYSMGKVSGYENIGGVVGILYGTVTNSYYIGAVSGSFSIGGIVGIVHHRGTVNNCYSSGTVSGTYSIGGVVGRGNNVINNYSISIVSGESAVGGIVGEVENRYKENTANNVALNPSIKTPPESTFGRVIGKLDEKKTTLSNNVAFIGMTNNAGNTLWLNKSDTEKNGADITKEQIMADGTLGGRFTEENGWTVENGKLPGFDGKAVDLPQHLK